jgi:hydroxymethylpyrimidine pyrophosphatase-like HAD family hydrolase
LDLFDLVVVENGALLFNPTKKEETPLAEPPSPAFVARLCELGVSPLCVGRTIVATWESHQETVLDVIQEFALELHIVFNKGAVVVLPGNVNKAWGLKSALKPLCLSPHNVVGIGNAENDQVFLSPVGARWRIPHSTHRLIGAADGDRVLGAVLKVRAVRLRSRRANRCDAVLKSCGKSRRTAGSTGKESADGAHGSFCHVA